MNSAEKSVTGTTTDDYVAIPTITAFAKRATVAIENVGGDDLTVKVTTKHNVNGTIEFTEVDEVVIPAGTNLRYVETILTAKIIVYIKSTTPGVPTDYKLEFIMGTV